MHKITVPKHTHTHAHTHTCTHSHIDALFVGSISKMFHKVMQMIRLRNQIINHIAHPQDKTVSHSSPEDDLKLCELKAVR